MATFSGDVQYSQNGTVTNLWIKRLDGIHGHTATASFDTGWRFNKNVSNSGSLLRRNDESLNSKQNNNCNTPNLRYGVFLGQ